MSFCLESSLTVRWWPEFFCGEASQRSAAFELPLKTKCDRTQDMWFLERLLSSRKDARGALKGTRLERMLDIRRLDFGTLLKMLEDSNGQPKPPSGRLIKISAQRTLFTRSPTKRLYGEKRAIGLLSLFLKRQVNAQTFQ